MDDPAVEINLPALAVDHVVGRGDLRVHGRGIGDELEGRAGLVDIADGVVAQQVGLGVAKLVGIEGGTDGEGENLAGVHILHDDGAVERLRFLHGVIERALGHELDVFVDGEHQVAAGLGVALAGAQNFAARVHGRVHRAGRAVEFAVEFFFKAAEAVVVDANVAQHLRGELVVGIEALKLLLEVNALHVEGLHGGGDLRRDAARDPGEVMAGVEACGDRVWW